LLGFYLSGAPEEIPFSYGPQGKPAIGVDSLLRFNISHSGDFVLLAFTRECDIGVDIEQCGRCRTWTTSPNGSSPLKKDLK
jgi:4'-phosphopantetheinyl transferase